MNAGRASIEPGVPQVPNTSHECQHETRSEVRVKAKLPSFKDAVDVGLPTAFKLVAFSLELEYSHFI